MGNKIIGKVNVPKDHFININDSVIYDYRLVSESENTQEHTPIEKFVDRNYCLLNFKKQKKK